LIGDNQPTFLQIGTGAKGAAPGITLFSAIAFVMCVISSTCLIVAHSNNTWIKNIPGSPVEESESGPISTAEVISALKVIPTLMCINIGFNVGYNGMDIYGSAACQMDVRVPDVGWLRSILLLPEGQFNGPFFSLGNNAAIIIAIPLLEGVIMPKLKRMRGGRPVPRKAKYIAGFLLIILANVTGSVIEIMRRAQPFIDCPAADIGSKKCQTYMDSPDQYLVSQCSPASSLPMNAISGWWTFVPYFITGCGEVLVNPVVQEFAFDEVAPRLRSFMMGFALVTMGCTPSVITAVFSGFIPQDLNQGNVIWCYVANIVVSLVLLCAYFFIAIPDKVIHAADAPDAERSILREA